MGSVSSTSSSSGRSGGSEYTGKLYFDPDLDQDYGREFMIADSELKAKVRELVDSTDPILKVIIWRHPLEYGLNAYTYHAYVIIETKNWWWSIEKNSEGVTLQRSKHCTKVGDEYRRQRRRGPFIKVREAAAGRGTSITDLIDFIWRKNLLASPYNFLFDNCKYFAAAVFNEVCVAGTRECTVGVGLRLLSDLP